MHFRSLAVFDMEDIQVDPMYEQEIRLQKFLLKETLKENSLKRIYLEYLTCVSTAFGREAKTCIEVLMDRYSYDPLDQSILKFEDKTDYLLEEYNGTTTCLKLPNGKIVEIYDSSVREKYVIQNNCVYQKNFGVLHQPKRTKRAKKIQILENYPLRKVYKTFETFAVQAMNAVRDEKTGGYGYMYNPYEMYDWYCIGGRWPRVFLVKETCSDFVLGEIDPDDKCQLDVPEGYKWCCGARLKDIEWDVLREWRNKKATEKFYQLQKMYKAGKLDGTVDGRITKQGIESWGHLIYRKGDWLKKYLREFGIPKEWRYPILISDIFDKDGVTSCEDVVWCEKTNRYKVIGHKDRIWDYLDKLDETKVIVGIDYHC